jgi:hypothetical protein
MKKYKSPYKNEVRNPGLDEAIKQYGMAVRKFDKPQEMSWWQARKLEIGKSYITKKGKLAWRISLRDEIGNWSWIILSGILFPFMWVGKRIGRAFHNFFYMKTNFRNNGIFGPGYASWHEEHFSWGKLSFVLVIAFIIVYFIFLR